MVSGEEEKEQEEEEKVEGSTPLKKEMLIDEGKHMESAETNDISPDKQKMETP
jgi:hypothetical protein